MLVLWIIVIWSWWNININFIIFSSKQSTHPCEHFYPALFQSVSRVCLFPHCLPCLNVQTLTADSIITARRPRCPSAFSRWAGGAAAARGCPSTRAPPAGWRSTRTTASTAGGPRWATRMPSRRASTRGELARVSARPVVYRGRTGTGTHPPYMSILTGTGVWEGNRCSLT